VTEPPHPEGPSPYGQPQRYQPYGQPQGGYPTPYATPAAPFGVDPVTGFPYSDKSKVVAGVLQIVIPIGIGRFYTGHTGIGVAQLLVTLVTCGIGSLWPLIDGIMILVGNPLDANGRPLRS